MNTSSLSEQKFMNRLTAIIEKNLDNETFGVAELAKELRMSRSNLHRKVKAITKITAVQFIRQVRLKAAMEMLKGSSYTVSEITYKTGFSSPSYFVKCFHEYYGFPPGEVKYRDFNEPVITSIPTNKKKKIKLSWVFVFLLLSIILFIAFNNYISSKDDKKLSIAVLPFTDDSPEEGSAYIINGIMEEIINKLEKIEGFEVVSRTSAENYRNTDKNIKTIARELGVNYILEGSGQKIGDKIKLSIQLIESKSDMHLWSKPFIKEVIFENIFELYEEVATSVAEELKTNLTPAEKEHIKKLPTNNIAAYNLYLRGLDHLSIYNYGRNTNELFIAKRLFEQAIKLDTTFADSYRQLGHICITALSAYPDLKVSIHFLELGKTLIDKAIYFDENQNVLATQMTYYLKKGMFQEAEDLFKNTYSDKVKDYKYYENAFNFYQRTNNSEAIESFYRFIQLKPEELMVSPQTWLDACKLFNSLGYSQIAKKYAEKLLIQTSDTVLYYYVIAEGQLWEGNIRNARDEALKGHKVDKPLFSANRPVFILGYCGLLLRDYSNFLKYLKYIEDMFAGFKYPVAPDVGMGYAYMQNGMAKKADYHFNSIENRSLKEIDLNMPDAQKFDAHFNLALIYSIRGEKTKAIGYLKKIKQKETIDIWSITQLKYHPAFDSIRDESEFSEIVKDAEFKYQKEHERVGKIIKKYETNKLNE